jgi:hypothetical protein
VTSWKDDKSHKRVVRAVIRPDRVDRRELLRFASATARNTRVAQSPKPVHSCSAGREHDLLVAWDAKSGRRVDKVAFRIPLAGRPALVSGGLASRKTTPGGPTQRSKWHTIPSLPK